MDSQSKKCGFWAYMWTYLCKYRKSLIITVICSAIVGVCVACQPLVIKYIVDGGILNKKFTSTQKLEYTAVMCGVYMFFSVTRMQVWRIGLDHVLRAMEGSIFEIRSKFFNHVQNMCMYYYDHTSVGDLFNCIMGSPMIKIKDYMQQIFIGIPYQLVSFLISLIALASYNVYLTLILLAVATTMAIVNYSSRKKIRSAFTDYIKTESEASKYLSDTLNGMDAVKLYSVEAYTFHTFKNFIGAMYDKGRHAALTQEIEAQKPQLVHFTGNAILYLIGALFCIKDRISVGELYAFLTASGTILTMLTSILTLNLVKSGAEAGLGKIRSVLEDETALFIENPTHLRNVEVCRESAIAKGAPCIEFENVDFGYDDKLLFNKLNCNIKYKESVALVGSSGGGKSTFIKLPLRLYDVSGGSVKVHGCDVRDFDVHDLRVTFGIVPQNPYIFSGTIWENITIGFPDTKNSDVIRAMEIAHVHEFVNELPDGWATKVGDGALNLSGGQKQRIAIARALLGNPDILIFDEATSALDNVSEKLIQQAMEELMKTHTVLIVAHRLSTIRNVDRIMVFDGGKVVQEGTYNELANKDGLFKELLDVASK